MSCGGISQKHLPSLKRERVRANHVELGQLPHNHECAFSDIIKMHWALKQASMGWLCSRGKWTLKNEANLFTLLLLAILYEVSLDWLHQTTHYSHCLKVTKSFKFIYHLPYFFLAGSSGLTKRLIEEIFIGKTDAELQQCNCATVLLSYCFFFYVTGMHVPVK